MIRQGFCLSLLILLFCSFVHSQGEDRESINKLVGTKEKLWIFDRFENYLGNNKCKKGESWTFLKDGRVVVKKCVDGVVKSEEKAWSLERKSPLDIAIKVGEVEYLLLFPPRQRGSSKDAMILRLKSDIKVNQTTDMLFYHEVD